jgi:hypothetical protein
MHFWNKLSTAALMRLTILASLNLVLARVVGDIDILLHPWFFLVIVTLNLGLYAIMVYSGSLNTSLIGAMLGGLAATLGTIAYTGMDSTAFMYGGPFQELGRSVESLLARALVAVQIPVSPSRRGPLGLTGDQVARLGYLAVDALGLSLIAIGGWSARRLHGRQKRPDAETVVPPP